MIPTFISYDSTHLFAVVTFWDSDFNGGRPFRKVCYNQSEVDNAIELFGHMEHVTTFRSDVVCNETKTA